MSRRTLGVLVLVFALALTAHGQGGSPITFHYGSPGEHATFALAINDAGQIGGLVADPDGSWPGLGMIHQGGHFTIFRYLGGIPQGPEYTTVNSINNFGDTVGVFSSALGGDAAFLRRANGTFVTLPVPPNAQGLTPTGINDWRQIVGTYQKGGVTHGFLLTNINRKYVTIDYPGPGARSKNYETHITGINNIGIIVGYFTFASKQSTGFVYRRGAFSRFLCKVHGKAVATKLLGINNRGQMLVDCNGSYYIHDSEREHLIAINYSSLPYAVITGLNRFGDVVGYYNPADRPSTYYSFIIPGVLHSAHR